MSDGVEFKRMQPHLGTFVEIKIQSKQSQIQLERITDAAFAIFGLVKQLMTIHEPLSDICQLMQTAWQTSYSPHPWTLAVLKKAKRIFLATQGQYDCMRAAQVLMQKNRRPNYQCSHQQLHSRPFSLNDLALLADGSAKLTHPSAIDLGGIAKGFAVDMAYVLLHKMGLKKFVINAGGDLRVSGVSHMVHIRRPDQPSHAAQLGYLTNGACATSANYFLDDTNNQNLTELINPFQNSLTPNKRTNNSYTVLAPTATVADALTKVLALDLNRQSAIYQQFGAIPIVIPS